MRKYFILLLFSVYLLALYGFQPVAGILNGEKAKNGEFPYQVSIRHYYMHICGGSIISANYVLTAAHCVSDTKKNGRIKVYSPFLLDVRAGFIKSIFGGVVSKVKKLCVIIHNSHVHEQYSAIRSGIALLELKTPLVFSEFIQPIPIASAEVPAGKNVTISGWGLRHSDDILNAWTLHWKTVQSISKSECYRRTHYATETVLCLVSHDHNGACGGDSGGPAVYNGELGGVTSFTVGTCGSPHPDGYADVYYHRDWIIRNSDL